MSHLTKLTRGHSQTTFTVMGGGGVHEMSTLLNKFDKFYQVKLSTWGEGRGQKRPKICQRSL